MATSEVRKQHPKCSCPHEDQARLLALRSAHHSCSLWRIPRQIFTALLPPPHPPPALLCHHSGLPYVPPEEAEANKWREQDPESVPGSVLLHLLAGLFTSPSLNSLTSKMSLIQPQWTQQIFIMGRQWQKGPRLHLMELDTWRWKAIRSMYCDRAMTNINSILISRDITLCTKVCLVKAMVFPVVMYGCESWSIKKAECPRIDAFELWCWRRLLRVPWTAKRSNQSILKEINPEYLLEGLMLKLKLQYFGHLMQRTDSLEKTPMLGKIADSRRRGWQRMRWLDGITNSMNKFEQAPWVGDGQGILACCSPWGHKELDMTEQLSWTELNS